MSRDQMPPKRPMLPATLLVLVALLMSEVAVLRGVIPAPPARLLAMGTLGAAAMVAVAFWKGGGLASLCSLVVAGAIAGVVSSSVSLWGLAGFAGAIQRSPVSHWTFEVESDPSLGSYGYRCLARAMSDGEPIGHVWLSCSEEPGLGDSISCVGRFSPNADDDWGRTSQAQGVAGTVRVVRVVSVESARGLRGAILRLRSRATGAFDPAGSGSGALLAASVCGYQAGMDERGLSDLFSTCGVSHLVAVSGGHIAIVAGILSALLEGIVGRPAVRAACLVLLSGLFVAFCGAPVSALRSWLMVLVSIGAQLAGRRGHALSAVCLVGMVMALVDPFVSGQIGFVLSVVSVVALCVFAPYASYALDVLLWPPRLRAALGRQGVPANKAVHALQDTLGATLVAQAATLPITVPSFGELSLVAPVANVALGLPFSALIGAGMLASLLGCLPGGGPLLAHVPLLVGRASADFALGLLSALSRLPLACVPASGWAVPLMSVSGLILLFLIWPRIRRDVVVAGAALAACVVGLVLFRWRFLAPARIIVLDVGQGDAIVVQDGAACLLVDTGPDASVAQALAREHILHLDAIVLTHLHEDHVGGVDDLVGTVGCGRVYVGEGAGGHESPELVDAIARLSGVASEELRYGDELVVGGFELRVVSPLGPASGTENADSIELAVSYGQSSGTLTALLTGDAESDRTGEAIGRGDVGDVDLLKVGHHGSAASLTAEEALVLNPELSVASAGEGNRYGHPTAECVDILGQAGSSFLCTKDVGDVEVRPGRSGPVVRYDGARDDR